ncbi:MAG: hypothetical protein ACR2IQ_01265, partial [Minisyncoccia bacterium]
NIKTEDNYSINIACQFNLKVKNGFNAFYGVTIPGRWINKFHSICFSAFTEFGLSKNFKNLRADIVKKDTASDLWLNRLEPMNSDLVRSTGHTIIDFNIIGIQWDKTDPMFTALENVDIAIQKKLAVFQEQEAEDKKNKVDAEKIERNKKAEAAGIIAINKAEQDFIKEVSDKEGGGEILKYHYLSKMENLISLNTGGENSDLTLVKNVDGNSGKKNNRGNKKT